MARTFKDKKYTWWKTYRGSSWRLDGHPPLIGGAWNGLHWYARRHNRQLRRWWNMALVETVKQIWRDAPERRFARDAKYDIY